MAFDGITIHCLVSEIRDRCLNRRINKIAQPEKDALMLTIKGENGNEKILISASASLPLLYFTGRTKANPMTAPGFCMLLRKYISNAKITNVYQPGLERIIILELEHFNELGDPCKKKLIVELMGKHSNIIFCNENDLILDSIKHIPASVSSVREVLPGRQYFIPQNIQKADPFHTDREEFYNVVCSRPTNVTKAIYSGYTGLSSVAASEICYRAGIEGDRPTDALNDTQKIHLFHTFELFMDDVKNECYCPQIVYEKEEPREFVCFTYEQFSDLPCKQFQSISETLETYYSDKESYTRSRQRSFELRRVVSTALERNRKKYELQLKQLEDTKEMDKYKVYGELLHTYGYDLKGGEKDLTCINYYTNEPIRIPLDETKTAMENATRYFDKYNKMKRTKEAMEHLLLETKSEIQHLETVLNSLDIATNEDDLLQIKEELALSGYIRRHASGKKKTTCKSRPFHYRSSDGYDIYVGKNNIQNDELTFKFANGNDWWFHAKKMPGSHVIVKSQGTQLPDRVFEEAAKLAAYYSKGRGNDKIEIDYVLRKEVKKPGGSKPGFVVYYTNFSMSTDSDISGLTLISE
ncbi:MAG: NFACT family protein [Lachnospiraceae bacterium]